MGAKARRGRVSLFLCLQMAGLAAVIPVLGRLSLPRLEALLGRGPCRGDPDPARVREIIACAGAVLRVGGRLRIIRRDCLTRGLLLYHFLRRAGMNVGLCFGAAYAQNGPEAHCWLVYDGQPFLEPQDPRHWYTEISRLSPQPCAERGTGHQRA